MGSPGGTVIKNPGNIGLIPGLGRSPGVGNVNPLQYSCLDNSMDRRAWQATVQGAHTESDTVAQLSMHTHSPL